MLISCINRSCCNTCPRLHRLPNIFISKQLPTSKLQNVIPCFYCKTKEKKRLKIFQHIRYQSRNSIDLKIFKHFEVAFDLKKAGLSFLKSPCCSLSVWTFLANPQQVNTKLNVYATCLPTWQGDYNTQPFMTEVLKTSAGSYTLVCLMLKSLKHTATPGNITDYAVVVFRSLFFLYIYACISLASLGYLYIYTHTHTQICTLLSLQRTLHRLTVPS